jgi:hypothetical protein
MKTAGDILSALFDERFMKKARGYSKLFDSWEDITAKNGIAAAAAHSRIKDLDRGILLVEMDHPGWKQILQTKQSKLLNDFRHRFPDLGISGISLILGRSETMEAETESTMETTIEHNLQPEQEAEEIAVKGYDAIEDEDFKEMLKKLEKTISAKNKSKNN